MVYRILAGKSKEKKYGGSATENPILFVPNAKFGFNENHVKKKDSRDFDSGLSSLIMRVLNVTQEKKYSIFFPSPSLERAYIINGL